MSDKQPSIMCTFKLLIAWIVAFLKSRMPCSCSPFFHLLTKAFIFSSMASGPGVCDFLFASQSPFLRKTRRRSSVQLCRSGWHLRRVQVILCTAWKTSSLTVTSFPNSPFVLSRNLQQWSIKTVDMRFC